jgi:hypothetical protein
MDDDIATHAVTGTQRTMSADLQGDGNWEFCYNPFHFLLRQLQRFEFEVRAGVCAVGEYCRVSPFAQLVCFFLFLFYFSG